MQTLLSPLHTTTSHRSSTPPRRKENDITKKSYVMGAFLLVVAAVLFTLLADGYALHEFMSVRAVQFSQSNYTKADPIARPTQKQHGFLFKALDVSLRHAMGDGWNSSGVNGIASPVIKAVPFPVSCDHISRDEYETQERKIKCTEVNQTDLSEPSINDKLGCYPRQLIVRCVDEMGLGGLSPFDSRLLAKEYYFAESIIEFGVGVSTGIAAETNVPYFVGVDSSDAWISSVRDVVPHRFRFHLGDAGKVADWGIPKNTNLSKIPLNYQVTPLFGELYPFDVYMVDGRYRVACAVLSFLHAVETAKTGDEKCESNNSSAATDARVLVHDYTTRENYHVIETVATIVDRADSLVLFSLKPQTTCQDLYNLWDKMKFTWQ